MSANRNATAPRVSTLRLVGDMLGQIHRNAPRLLPLMGLLWLLQFPTFVGDMDNIPTAALEDMGLPRGPANTALAIIAMLATHLGTAWCAVGWHRLTILDETPGPVLPRWHPGTVISYFVTAIVVGLASSLPVIALAALIYGLLSMLGLPQVVAAMLISPLAVAAIWLNLRLSPVLVGAALRRPTAFGDAYRMTAPLSRPLWGLAVLGILEPLLLLSGAYWFSSTQIDDQGYYLSYTAMYLDSAVSMLTVFLSFLAAISAYNVIYARVAAPAPTD